MDYQKTILVGRLTKDAKIHAANGDKGAMASFALAVGTGKEQTSYFDVELRGDSVENVQQYLVKGKEVLVEGNITAKAYAKNDGTPGASLVLYAYTVKLGADSRNPGASDPV